MIRFLLLLSMLPTASLADYPGSPYIQGNKLATYSSSIRVTPGSTPEDVCVLGGSDSKTIRVNQVTLATIQSTAGHNLWRLIKRSNLFPVYTHNGQTMPMVPLDLATVSATASSIALVSNASSSGTSIGAIKTFYLFSPVTTTAGSAPTIVWDMDRDAGGHPIVLRGRTDTVAINFNAVALPAGMQVTCGFTWSEE